MMYNTCGSLEEVECGAVHSSPVQSWSVMEVTALQEADFIVWSGCCGWMHTQTQMD